VCISTNKNLASIKFIQPVATFIHVVIHINQELMWADPGGIGAIAALKMLKSPFGLLHYDRFIDS